MKKTLLGILIFTLICALSINVFAADATYTDDNGHWAEEAIENLTKEEIVTGYSDNSFKPEDEITRAEYITMLVRMFKPTKLADISSYTDVAQDAWYFESIAKAVGMGVVQGDNATTMRPESNITRQEAMLILFRLLKFEGSKNELTFTDAADVASWAKEGIAALADAKFVNGYLDGSLKPVKNTTRAEAAELLNKALATAKALGQVSGDLEEIPTKPSGRSSSSRNDKVAEIIFTETEDAYTITASGDKASNNNTLIVTVVALDGTETTVLKNKLSSAGYANDLAAVAESDALNAEKLVKTLVSSEKYYNNGLAKKWGSAVALKLTSAELAAGQPVKDSIPEVYEAIAGVHGEGTAEYIKGLAAEQATVAFTAAEYDDVISTLASL